MSLRLEEEVVRERFGAEPQWLRSTRVRIVRTHEVVWEGAVSVWALPGERPRRAYSWMSIQKPAPTTFHAALHEGAVDSAEAAIEAWLDASRRATPRRTPTTHRKR